MAGYIPPAVLDQIRASNEIVEIIGAAVPLKRAGANWTALCPFHKEKSPSFSVNPQKQIFYCFGCHKGGDVFRFLQEYEGITFPEAIKRLAERAKISIEFESPRNSSQKILRDTLLNIHDQICQRWHIALNREPSAQIARDYLAKRGVSPEAIKSFRLGFAPDEWDDTVNWAKSKGFDMDSLEQAGLILKKEGESRYYSRFRGRLMFPICDEQGRVIGFSGRVLAGDEKTRKYVNSPETPLFHKSRVIFGLDKAKRALLDRQYAIICEGQLDLIACHGAGLENTVAPQGTALTADQIRILKRYVNEVVLCFDSDKAGINATIRALDDLLSSGMAIRVAPLPAPHDPDSFIKEFGAEEFRHHIESSEGFFDFYLKHLATTHDLKTDKGRLAVVRTMRDSLQKQGSPVLIDTYAQKTALHLGVSPDSVRKEFKTSSSSTRIREFQSDENDSQSPSTETEPLPRPHPQEFWLLKLVLQLDDLLPITVEKLRLEWIADHRVHDVMTRKFRDFANQTTHSVPSLLEELVEEPETMRLATEAAVDDRSPPNTEQQLLDCIKGIRDRYIDRQIAELNLRFSTAAPSQFADIQTQQLELMKLKKTPV